MLIKIQEVKANRWESRGPAAASNEALWCRASFKGGQSQNKGIDIFSPSLNNSVDCGSWETFYSHWFWWSLIKYQCLVSNHITLESPLDCKEIQPVHPKGKQSWIFIGRTDAEAEIPILWPVDAKSCFFGKDPDAGEDWRQEEKSKTEDEMVEWHHQLNGHEFEQAPGIDDGQGSLAGCIHGAAKSQTRLNDWTELNWIIIYRDIISTVWKLANEHFHSLVYYP